MKTHKAQSGIPEQYRQGDVLLIETTRPVKAQIQPRDNDRRVLEYGEVTGHAHAIYEKDSNDLYLDGARRYLEMCYVAPLKHEEHDQIEIPTEKTFEVRRAYTWSVLTEMAQQVRD